MFYLNKCSVFLFLICISAQGRTLQIRTSKDCLLMDDALRAELNLAEIEFEASQKSWKTWLTKKLKGDSEDAFVNDVKQHILLGKDAEKIIQKMTTERNDSLLVVAPSGLGKSSTLRQLAAIWESSSSPNNGRISLYFSFGRSFRKLRTDLGSVDSNKAFIALLFSEVEKKGLNISEKIWTSFYNNGDAKAALDFVQERVHPKKILLILDEATMQSVADEREDAKLMAKISKWKGKKVYAHTSFDHTNAPDDYVKSALIEQIGSTLQLKITPQISIEELQHFFLELGQKSKTKFSIEAVSYIFETTHGNKEKILEILRSLSSELTDVTINDIKKIFAKKKSFYSVQEIEKMIIDRFSYADLTPEQIHHLSKLVHKNSKGGHKYQVRNILSEMYMEKNFLDTEKLGAIFSLVQSNFKNKKDFLRALKSDFPDIILTKESMEFLFQKTQGDYRFVKRALNKLKSNHPDLRSFDKNTLQRLLQKDWEIFSD